MEAFNAHISFKSNKFKKKSNFLVSDTFSSFEGRCKNFQVFLLPYFIVPVRVIYASKRY